MQSQALRALKLGLISSQRSQALNLMYDMDVYMEIFSGGEAWDLC